MIVAASRSSQSLCETIASIIACWHRRQRQAHSTTVALCEVLNVGGTPADAGAEGALAHFLQLGADPMGHRTPGLRSATRDHDAVSAWATKSGAILPT